MKFNHFFLLLLGLAIASFTYPAFAEIVNSAKRGIIDTAEKMADAKPEMKKLIPKCNKKCTEPKCEKQRTKDCDKLEKLVQQTKADEQGIKQQAGAGSQAGGGDMMKALSQMLPMLAQGNKSAPKSFADDPETAVAALADIEKSIGGFGAARGAVQAAQLADKIEKSGILENASSGGEIAAAGLPSFAGGGGSSGLGGSGSPTEVPIPGSQTDDPNADLAEKSSELTFGGSSGGGSGSSGGGFSLKEDPLLAMNEPYDSNRRPSSTEKDDGEHTLLNGEKIGTMYDNVFEKVSQRYQFLKKANRFILDE